MRISSPSNTQRWRSRRTPRGPAFSFTMWKGWPIHWPGPSSTSACCVARMARNSSTSRSPSTSTWPRRRNSAELLVIGCRGRVCFPDSAVFHGDPAAGHLLKLPVGFIVKVTRQVFRRRVELDEGLEVVEHLVVDAVDHRTHHLLEQLEVQQEPCCVQFPAPQSQPNLVIVPVGVLALAAIVA